MSAPSPAESTPTAERALRELVESMSLVFDNDWWMTRETLNARPEPHVIAADGTFLNPGVQDESNNWWNRGALLAAYRQAVEVLRHGGAPLEDTIEDSVRSRQRAEGEGDRG